MAEDIAISVNDVSKMYKLYDNPMDRLKESLGLSRKKKYKEHYALNHVSFQVHKGETVGIIGTNGSGKSTILKIITGVLSPTAGEIAVNGRISALLELGAGFNGEYSGLENVYLNGSMIGFSREEIDAKLQSILDFADIGDFIYQPVKTYSSGMFVRLAFAVAINIDPEILIVDEALSVGDVFFQAKCYRKFEEFKEMGKTILFVSHDLSSIGKYCDRVVLLNKGEKLAEGGAKEMVNLYRRVLVNQYDDADLEENTDDAEEGQTTENQAAGADVSLKAHEEREGKLHCRLTGTVEKTTEASRLVLHRYGLDARVKPFISIPVHNGKFEYDLYTDCIEAWQLYLWHDWMEGLFYWAKFLSEDATLHITIPEEGRPKVETDGTENRDIPGKVPQRLSFGSLEYPSRRKTRLSKYLDL